MTNNNNEHDIKQLNSFLRGELSAVETYRQVLEKAEDMTVRQQIEPGLNSHSRRALLLGDKIRALGGEPSKDSGVWGTFAKAVEGGAKAFGLSAAISVLEEGEDHGLSDYRADLSELSPASRAFVVRELLPEQQKTHDAMSRIKATV